MDQPPVMDIVQDVAQFAEQTADPGGGNRTPGGQFGKGLAIHPLHLDCGAQPGQFFPIQNPADTRVLQPITQFKLLPKQRLERGIAAMLLLQDLADPVASFPADAP